MTWKIPEVEAAIFLVITFYFITTKCFCLEREERRGQGREKSQTFNIVYLGWKVTSISPLLNVNGNHIWIYKYTGTYLYVYIFTMYIRHNMRLATMERHY